MENPKIYTIHRARHSGYVVFDHEGNILFACAYWRDVADFLTTAFTGGN